MRDFFCLLISSIKKAKKNSYQVHVTTYHQVRATVVSYTSLQLKMWSIIFKITETHPHPSHP